MKKPFLLILSALLVLLLPFYVCASGEVSDQEISCPADAPQGTTELTVTIESSYIASIPANTTLVAYKADAQAIGNVTVKDVKHAAAIICKAEGSNLINGDSELAVNYQYKIGSNAAADLAPFTIYKNGSPLSAALTATIPADEWAKAIAGTYKATVNFTFEVDNNTTDKTLLLSDTDFNAAIKDLVGTDNLSFIESAMFFTKETLDSERYYNLCKNSPKKLVSQSEKGSVFAYAVLQEENSTGSLYIYGPDGITIPKDFNWEKAFAGFTKILYEFDTEFDNKVIISLT